MSLSVFFVLAGFFGIFYGFFVGLQMMWRGEYGYFLPCVSSLSPSGTFHSFSVAQSLSSIPAISQIQILRIEVSSSKKKTVIIIYSFSSALSDICPFPSASLAPRSSLSFFTPLILRTIPSQHIEVVVEKIWKDEARG